MRSRALVFFLPYSLLVDKYERTQIYVTARAHEYSYSNSERKSRKGNENNNAIIPRRQNALVSKERGLLYFDYTLRRLNDQDADDTAITITIIDIAIIINIRLQSF